MKINKLDHVSIATDQLEDTKKFYCDLLGLKVGHRPKLKSSGYWLYSGEEAIIHLVETGSNLDRKIAFSDDKKTARPLGNPESPGFSHQSTLAYTASHRGKRC